MMGSTATRNGEFYSFLGWAGMGDKHWFLHKGLLEKLFLIYIWFHILR